MKKAKKENYRIVTESGKQLFKCKVLRNEKCFIGTLYEVDSNKNTFSIKQNNGEIIEINCADVEEIFSEEEIGTIN